MGRNDFNEQERDEAIRLAWERIRIAEKEKKKLERMKALEKRARRGILLGVCAGVLVTVILVLVMGLGSGSGKKEAVVTTAKGPVIEGEPVEEEGPVIEGEPVEEEGTVIEGEPVEEESTGTLQLIAVGDNIYHSSIIKSGGNENGPWSYDGIYEPIRAEIAAADLAVVNQECILVADHADASGYPHFGAPAETGEALVNAGFNVILNATNHTLDKGTDAIRQTLNYWEANHPETVILGIHENETEAETIPTVTKNGITLALLNYTAIMNGGMEKVQNNMVDIWKTSRVKADIAAAKEISDLVVVFLHDGKEYTDRPGGEMEDRLKVLLQQDVDLVICSHPHVLQKSEMVTNPSTGHSTLFYYSLGNFVSAQNDPATMLGGMASVTIRKTEEGTTITSGKLIPLVTYGNQEEDTFRIYKLDDYTRELAKTHRLYKEFPKAMSVKGLQSLYKQIVANDYTLQ